MATKEYYVYQLIDPRTNKAFYVGKGKNSRIDAHEKEAVSGSDHPKCKVIREIIADGLIVQKEIVKRFVKEDSAYRFEKNLIAKIGINNLTNLAPGGRCGWTVKKRVEDKDAQWIDIVSWFGRKTGGTFIAAFNFCGKKFLIDDRIAKSVSRKVNELVATRGKEWVLKEFKKHNVNIDFVSKVDSHVCTS